MPNKNHLFMWLTDMPDVVNKRDWYGHQTCLTRALRGHATCLILTCLTWSSKVLVVVKWRVWSDHRTCLKWVAFSPQPCHVLPQFLWEIQWGWTWQGRGVGREVCGVEHDRGESLPRNSRGRTSNGCRARAGRKVCLKFKWWIIAILHKQSPFGQKLGNFLGKLGGTQPKIGIKLEFWLWVENRQIL